MKSTNRTLAQLVAVASIALAAPAFAHPGGMGAGCGQGNGPGGCTTANTESGCGMGMHGGKGMHGGMGMRGGMGMQGGGMGMGPMQGRGGYGNTAGTAEARLAFLKTELNITSKQEAAWNVFATNASKQAEGMQALRQKVQGNTGTAPERLALRAEAMKQRAATAEGAAAGLKDLYAALTTEQKAILDRHFERRGPGAMAWNNPAK